MIVFDADLLAGLPPDEEEYKTVSQLIREEYACYTDKDFYSGRKGILKAYLRRDTIFYTFFASKYEEATRSNIENEITEIERKIETEEK